MFLLEELRLAGVKESAWDDPKYLLNEMRGFDPTQQEHFSFNMFDPTAPWYWQADVVDDIMANGKTIWLKARQLGMTWVAVAIGLWYILMRPGATVVCYSHGEAEAIQLVRRAWQMFQSLPQPLRDHVTVIRPTTELPNEWIIVKHADGRISSFRALPSTEKAGHGETVTFAIMDEVARQEYARSIFTAINPAVSRGGRLALISTANGLSNKSTGTGNFFHRLWVTRRERNIFGRFLPWDLHPERDEAWYAKEAMALDEVERNQQYPRTEDDAFMLSGTLYFNSDALAWYRGETRNPLFCGQFLIEGKTGTFTRDPSGAIEVYAMPRQGAKYGISADVASGKAEDYSSADVIDLDTAEIVAHFHSKIEIPAFAKQLKFLGRWYCDTVTQRPALIMPERAGGWGEALIISLVGDDGGLDSYPMIYRHTTKTRSKRPVTDTYGFPMNVGTRGTVLEQLKEAVRNRRIPWLTEGHLDECATFVYKDAGTSPRAEDGNNDDCVISLALAWQLYLLSGNQPQQEVRNRRWRKRNVYVPGPMKAGVNS